MDREALMKLEKNEIVELLLVAFQRIAELEVNAKIQAEEIASQKERLNKNSQNSSKPPSSDGYKKPQPKSLRERTGKKPGAQHGHEGNGFSLPHEADETVLHHPTVCERCAHDLTQEQGEAVTCATRYVVDIRIETQVIAHQTTEVICPECGQIAIGSFPNGINSTLQYGDTIKALAIALNTAGTISINRTHEILQSVFGVPISTGTISGMIEDCAEKVKPALEKIKSEIINSPVVNCDETGIRADKKLHWAHSASTNVSTYIIVDPKRGQLGMDNAGILPEFLGIAVHDCWSPYFLYDCEHALCNAHLLRELTNVEENYSQSWATNMIQLLLDMKEAKEQCIEMGIPSISEEQWQEFMNQYDELLKIGKEMNPIPPAEANKRGKPKKGKILSLLERLETYKAGVCLFAKNFFVPFTNNQAEQDIRVFKVKEKVTGGFRTTDGANDYASIVSYISTARKRGFSIFDSIKHALAGNAISILMPATTE